MLACASPCCVSGYASRSAESRLRGRASVSIGLTRPSFRRPSDLIRAALQVTELSRLRRDSRARVQPYVRSARRTGWLARTLLRSSHNNKKRTLLHKQASDHGPVRAGPFSSRRTAAKNKAAAGPPWKVAPVPSGQDAGRGARQARNWLAPSLSGSAHPHLLSPQFRQVMQPSIITTAAVLHLVHNCAPSGKCDFANASVCF